MISLLLLLPSLLHSTTGSVYNVTPDDHYYPNTTCHHCHNLQHYLLNTTKYFTSNTKLLFLPGLHHLHTNLIIQNVHNISLIGSTTNGKTSNTIIHCSSSAGFIMTNVTNLVIKYMVINNCTKRHSNISIDLLLEECYNVQLIHIEVFGGLVHDRCGLVAMNILGNSVFTGLKSNGVMLLYGEVEAQGKHHKLLIEDYHIVLDEDVYDDTIIKVRIYQQSYRVEFEVYNSTFSFINDKILIKSWLTLNKFGNLIHINHCVIIHFSYRNMFISQLWKDLYFSPYKEEKHHLIQFTNCKFLDYSAGRIPHFMDKVLIDISSKFIDMMMENCAFKNGTFQAIRSYASFAKISNTNFSSITCRRALVAIDASDTLQLVGPVLFTYINIEQFYAVISIAA